MKKLLLYFCGGIITLLLLIAPFFTHQALAYQGQCHLKHCLVPAPTILGPTQGEVVKSLRPGIKGLTWKTTIVKVYLDGQELTNVKQVKHQDYYGSFYVQPNFDLTPGEHYVYTIAHSEKPGWYDQSKESIYIYFTVEKPPLPIISQKTVAPVPPTTQSPQQQGVTISQPAILGEDVAIVEPQPTSQGVAVEAEKETAAVSVSQQPTPGTEPAKPEKTEADELNLQGAAGVSDLGEILQGQFVDKEVVKKAKRNRAIGLAILALIIVISVIWLVADKRYWQKKIAGQPEGELPPPPQPLTKGKEHSQESVITKGKEITPPPIEPATNKYFATPPPSPYSPYPPKSEEVKYMPIDHESNLDAGKAIDDLEERIRQEEQDRLI